MALFLSGGDAEADALLETDAFALLIGMLLDQQVPMERAFSAPLALRARLGGTLDVATVLATDPERLRQAFAQKPALHRFPAAMADRTASLARVIEDRFGGDPAAVWTGAADGADLLRRVRQLPGFGEQKARIFIALLGKRLGITVPGWERAAGAFGEPGVFRSVADIDSPDALQRVRAHKADVKAATKQLARLEADGAGAGGRPRRASAAKRG